MFLVNDNVVVLKTCTALHIFLYLLRFETREWTNKINHATVFISSIKCRSSYLFLVKCTRVILCANTIMSDAVSCQTNDCFSYREKLFATIYSVMLVVFVHVGLCTKLCWENSCVFWDFLHFPLNLWFIWLHVSKYKRVQRKKRIKLQLR